MCKTGYLTPISDTEFNFFWTCSFRVANDKGISSTFMSTRGHSKQHCCQNTDPVTTDATKTCELCHYE